MQEIAFGPLALRFCEVERFTNKFAKVFRALECDDSFATEKRCWSVVEGCKSCLDMLKAAVLFNRMFPKAYRAELRDISEWLAKNREFSAEMILSGLHYFFSGVGKDDPVVSDVELIESAYYLDAPDIYYRLRLDFEKRVEAAVEKGTLRERAELLHEIESSSLKDEPFFGESSYKIAAILGERFLCSKDKLGLGLAYQDLGITKLSLNGSKLPVVLDEANWEPIRRISTLQELEFKSLYFRFDKLPRQLSSLKISSFKFESGNSLRDAPMGLRTLEIRCSDITGSFFRDMPCLIERLVLNQCNEVDDTLAAYLPAHLTDLDVTSCHRLSDVTLSKLPPTVWHLKVGCLDKVTDAAMARLPPALKTLDVSNTSVTDKGIKLVPLTVTRFDLSDRITDGGLFFLPPHLFYLGLANNKNISIKGLLVLPQVRELNLSMTRVTDNDTKVLPKALRVLDLSKTRVQVPSIPPGVLSLNLSHTAVTKEILENLRKRILIVTV